MTTDQLKNAALAVSILATIGGGAWTIVDTLTTSAYDKGAADIILKQSKQRNEELTSAITFKLKLDECESDLAEYE